MSKVNRILIALAWLSGCGLVSAQTVSGVISNDLTRGRTYIIAVAPDGTTTLSLASAVLTPNGGPTPPVPQPPTGSLKQTAANATRTVQDPDKQDNGKRVAAVYRLMSRSMDQVPSQEGAQQLLNRLIDNVSTVFGQGIKTNWRPVAVATSAAMPAFSQQAYKQAYLEIAEGIEDGLKLPASARALEGDGKPRYISDRFWDFLLRLLELLIPLLFPNTVVVGEVSDWLPVVTHLPKLEKHEEDEMSNTSGVEDTEEKPIEPPKKISLKPELAELWSDMHNATSNPTPSLTPLAMSSSRGGGGNQWSPAVPTVSEWSPIVRSKVSSRSRAETVC